jgi:hypothetical protein
MRHIIYKITNNINGKYYIGRHSTNNIDDGYMGSGIGIKNAINKYGIDNFTREIIGETGTSDLLWELEKEVVNEEVVKDKNSYNMCYGGKHFLHGLKEYDYEKFINHQKNAGTLGGIAAKKIRTSEWHKKGGSASSKKRSSNYIYKIQTNLDEVFVVNGWQFKELCKEKGWNHDTLYWSSTKHKTNQGITRGKHKGFKVELIESPHLILSQTNL